MKPVFAMNIQSEEKEKIPNDVDKQQTDLDKKENVDSDRNEIQCSEKVEQI